MYRINSANGFIHCPDGYVCKPPYDDEDLQQYLEYANWIQSGNSPEEFYEEPLPAVPESVTRFQARAALYQAGYLQAIETLMQDQNTPMIYKLAWQDASEFKRNSPTVTAMASALNLTDNDVDNLFRLASTIIA